LKLVVGLGNPGLFHKKNRHNLGYNCLKQLSKEYGIKLDKKRGGARTGAGKISGVNVILSRPQTYMNESGLAVNRLLDQLKLTPSDLIVIHDDMDLSLGKLRLSCGGGAGGHNGVQSVIDEMDSSDFIRLRIGIGRPDVVGNADNSQAVVDYVLSDFSAAERTEIDKVLPQATEAISVLLREGLNQAMNRFN